MFKNLKPFYPYLRQYKKFFLIGVIVLIIIDTVDLFLPQIIRFAIDGLADNVKGKETLLPITQLLFLSAAIYILFILFQVVFRFRMRIAFRGTSMKIARDIRSKLFRHLQTLSSDFFNKTKTGDIMSRATIDIEIVRMFYGRIVMVIVDIILYTAGALSIMLYFSPKLTLYILLIPPLLFLFVSRISRAMHRQSARIQARLATISTAAQENFAGIRVVKSFAREKEEIQSFRQLNNGFVRDNLDLAMTEARFSAVVRFLVGLGFLIILVVGGHQVINQEISVGTLVSFLMYLGYIIWPMMGLGMVIARFQRARASMDRLQQFFQTTPAVTSPAKPVDRKIKGLIEFRHVTLNYPQSGQPALKNINLQIKAGQTVVLLGLLGSGKSSLVNLIPRIFDPSQGEVLIDGVNARDLDLASLRRQIGYVSQDIFLFSETISGNIAFALDQADPEKITAAARVACIDNDIREFPKQYETILGERGV
ncbi:MAG: ABC transporter ATP-binding protein, partial [Planctomycetes bacterium]|nr:ABC transporter ATP-binding protein [Planctomycetota bacterium]